MNVTTSSESPFQFLPVSDLEPEAIRWLWPNRLADDKLAIIDGDPGLGKSLVTLDLCARLSTGRSFPDGSAGPGPSACLILNAEDAARNMIRPRLQALAADLERVMILNRLSCDERHVLSFPRWIPDLKETVRRTQARLVVIDPIVAFLDRSVSVASDPSVRQALASLAKVAEDCRCAILLIRHLNKGSNIRSLYRGGGSIGIVGACRSAWLIASDPYDSERRILAQVKNNLAGPQPSLAYTIQLTPDGIPTVAWQGQTRWTGDQLLREAVNQTGAVSNKQRAIDFLEGTLEKGPRTSRELWPLAQKLRLSSRMIKAAKTHLDIRSLRVWAEGKRLCYWLLPHQKLPDSVPAEAAEADLEEYLAPLREMYPPATPIDEL